MHYDKSRKLYRAANDFKPVFMEPEADAYLAQLRSSTGPDAGSSELWLAIPPEFDAMHVPHRRINVSVLRAILTAIRESHSLEIHYQSMSEHRPSPNWRRFTPHALGNDGLRWHIRAYCHEDEKFKDFILSRCLDARDFREPGACPGEDRLWHDSFGVALAPNPLLSVGQQEIIAEDFGMHNGRTEIFVRRALLYYFQKRLRLDVDAALDNPYEEPIVVANRPEFDSALAEAMR